MKYIWVKKRVQSVSHVVVRHRVFCLRIAECNDPKIVRYLLRDNIRLIFINSVCTSS